MGLKFMGENYWKSLRYKILIVTHRPSTIKYCDKIIKIENGITIDF